MHVLVRIDVAWVFPNQPAEPRKLPGYLVSYRLGLVQRDNLV